jgi:tetratricopeptide (TPR) repeat protein
MANELRNLGNYDGAASAYEAAIHIKADDSAAHCQLALIRARQGHLSQAVREYGAALVPAKLQELNDSECLVIVDHVLDESFGRPSSAQAAQAIAELIKIKEGMKLAAQSIPNALPSGAEKPKVLVQAVLHRPE